LEYKTPMLVDVSVVRRIPSEGKTLIHPEWEWIESSKPGTDRGADSGVVLLDPAVHTVPSRTRHKTILCLPNTLFDSRRISILRTQR
jgi:hypothetical protein